MTSPSIRTTGQPGWFRSQLDSGLWFAISTEGKESREHATTTARPLPLPLQVRAHARPKPSESDHTAAVELVDRMFGVPVPTGMTTWPGARLSTWVEVAREN